MSAEWVKVATYASGLDADLARATLETNEIPVQIRGQNVGMFGSSFQGPIVGGVDLYVPSRQVERALDLLEGAA